MTTNWNLCKERTTLYFKSQKKHGVVKAYANFSLTEALLNQHCLNVFIMSKRYVNVQ